MPLWNKTTTICAALLISAPFASESSAQRLSPLTPLPLPPVSLPQNAEADQSIFEVAPSSQIRRQTGKLNLLKPLAVPGAPIVRLAKRPASESSEFVNFVSPIDPVIGQPLKGVKRGRLLVQTADVAATSPKQQLSAPTEITEVNRAAEPMQHLFGGDGNLSQATAPVTEATPVATATTAVGVTNDFPLAAATPSVVVRSPFVQPGNPNRYLFMIENIGTVDAAGTRVDLRVPAGVVLKQVVADSASSTARHAIIHIDELKAGAKSIIEVEIQPTAVDVTFDTSLTLETKRSFQGTTLDKKIIVTDTSAVKSSMEPVTSSVATQVSYKDTPSAASPTAAVSSSVSTANLSATVEGPVMLDAGETGGFSIVVKNPNYEEVSTIVVQLTIPQGLKITTLDREAWINDEDNTISWELTSLGARQEETIQYKAIGRSAGQQLQKVTLGMADVYQGDAKLVTLVSQ